MSVYKPAKSSFYQYDFVIKGRRFHGSTGQVTRRAAEAAERRLRAEEAEGRLGDAASWTVDQAAGKWWIEVGQHRADAAEIERKLEWLVAALRPKTRLADLTTAVISDVIERLRVTPYKRGDKGAARVLSNATINRRVIELLRPIMRRAATNWGAKGLQEIDWRALRLVEPRGLVQHYSADQEAAWLAECEPTPALALRLLLTYGLRFGELFFPPEAFDPSGPSLPIQKRKRDVPLVLPLRDDDASDIAARVGRAITAGLPHIWYVEVVDLKGKVELVPLTYSMLRGRIIAAADTAGVNGRRRIHGARHHAGTMALRRTGNLKLAGSLLGHADLKSTARYAHALLDDLRAFVDDLPRNSPEPEASKAKKAS